MIAVVPRPVDVVRHAEPWRDVLVAVDAARFRNEQRRRQESRRPFLLRRKPAPGAIDAHGALQRQPAHRPLLLHEPRLPCRARVVHPRRNRLRELIRHAVVHAVRERLIVRHPRAVVGHARVLIAGLQGVGAGDIRHRPLPQVRAGMRHAEVLRSIRQAGDTAVGRTAARALLDHANEIPGWIGLAFEVADAEIRSAVPRFDQQAIGARATTRWPASHPGGVRARRPLPASSAAAPTGPASRPCTPGTWSVRPRSRPLCCAASPAT